MIRKSSACGTRVMPIVEKVTEFVEELGERLRQMVPRTPCPALRTNCGEMGKRPVTIGWNETSRSWRPSAVVIGTVFASGSLVAAPPLLSPVVLVVAAIAALEPASSGLRKRRLLKDAVDTAVDVLQAWCWAFPSDYVIPVIKDLAEIAFEVGQIIDGTP